MRSRLLGMSLLFGLMGVPSAQAIDDRSPLAEKAKYLEADLVAKHSLDGLYVSIVPSVPPGVKLAHTVDEPGNVIHAGVWTGRYLGGVGYQYAVSKDPHVREHGGQILRALRILQEVTGKPGLLARGYVKGHGPVVDWERDGADSKEWHQGQGDYADYRWYGDVSVDNFNAVLYGYAIYYDFAADDEQKRFIAHDVDRLMTHLLDNHCRIVDVDGEPTMWGHVGIDPKPDRAEYYAQLYAGRQRRGGQYSADKSPLRAQLMLLPDLLIADHITGKPRYLEFYRQVVEKFAPNPEPEFYRGSSDPERLARTNHSSEGQSYEALYNLVRYEKSPELLKTYRSWVSQLWERNWTEGNSVFTYMTLALLPEYRGESQRAARRIPEEVPHAVAAARDAKESLVLYPLDRVMRPVMNSLRKDIELNPVQDRARQVQAAKPVPMNLRPLDNEYVWKGNPYQLDGWLKPTVTAMEFSADDPQVAWFCDSSGRAFMTLDHGETWQPLNRGMMGGTVRNLAASKARTFVLWAQTDKGNLITRDGGLSWRAAPEENVPEFPSRDSGAWLKGTERVSLKIDEKGQLIRSIDDGKTSEPAMEGWRIPLAKSVFKTPWGIIASGPGGAYSSSDGKSWQELRLWRDEETGAADFLHAYWMGRFYGFLPDE